MPKPRIIDANFWNDPDIAQLSRDERLLLAAMITTCADDHGRLMAHSPYLRKMAFGYDDDITVADVLQMRNAIILACRNVVLYEVDGQEYIWLKKFQEYQKIRYQVKSKLPSPTDDCAKTLEVTASSRQTAPNSRRVGLGREELGGVDVGLGVAVVPKRTAATAAVHTAWQNARGGAVNQMDSEQINEFIDEYTAEWCVEAIKVANAARQDRLPSLNFVRSILDRYKKEGFKAPFDAKAKRAEIQARHQAEDEQAIFDTKLAQWDAKMEAEKPP